jgi:hypothetical protein
MAKTSLYRKGEEQVNKTTIYIILAIIAIIILILAAKNLMKFLGNQ